MEKLFSTYLSLTGQGHPTDRIHEGNIQALLTTFQYVRLFYRSMGNDFPRPRLESLWSCHAKTGEWEYRLLVRIPSQVEMEELQEAIQMTMRDKNLGQAKDITLYKMKRRELDAWA
jgi:hypothetical protein